MPPKRKSIGEDDSESDYAPEAPSTSTAAPTAAPAAKKPRASKKAAPPDPHAGVKALVKSIASSPTDFPLPATLEDARAKMVQLAEYAVVLEASLAATGGAVVKVKTAGELDDMAEKLSRTVCSQIKKQMIVSWFDEAKFFGTAIMGSCDASNASNWFSCVTVEA